MTGIDEAVVGSIVESYRDGPGYRPVVIIRDASLAQVASVLARRCRTARGESSSKIRPGTIQVRRWVRICSVTLGR